MTWQPRRNHISLLLPFFLTVERSGWFVRMTYTRLKRWMAAISALIATENSLS